MQLLASFVVFVFKVAVPWKIWRTLGLCNDLGADEADMAAAVGILRMLHTAPQHANIEVLSDPTKKGIHVKALDDIPAKKLELPPCIPKASKLFKESTHPKRVEVQVARVSDNVKRKNTGATAAVAAGATAPDQTDAAKVQKAGATAKDQGNMTAAEKVKFLCAGMGGESAGNAASAATAPAALESEDADHAAEAGGAAVVADASEKRTYYVHPEWSMPSLPEGTLDWAWDAGVTLHPFWAVRRLSAEQLEKENENKASLKNGVAKTFNCELITREFTVCHVGVFQSDSASLTVAVSLPILTNSRNIALGEELLLEVGQTKAAPKRKVSTWKEDTKKPRLAIKKAKAKAAPPASKKAATLEI